VPDPEDLFFTLQEHASNDSFTPCCSRSKSARPVRDRQPRRCARRAGRPASRQARGGAPRLAPRREALTL